MIGALTLASRVLGLARDMACSYAFGTGAVWSAFTVAFQAPNLFRRLFGEGALSAASIPVLTETLTCQGQGAMDRLAGRLMGLLIAVLVVLCLAAEGTVAILYWFYSDDSDTALTLALTALMLPYLIFICAAAILGGVQNVCGRFASAAAAPLILNVFMIAAAWGGAMLVPDLRRHIVVLAAAVVVSGILQMAWQWAAARRCGLRLPLSLDTTDPSIRRIGIIMLPMIAGMATVQLNTLADTLIAYWFVPGRVGPGILAYAQRLYQFPLGIFAIALATAIFPAMSRFAAQQDLEGLRATLSRGLRVASFEGIPCLVGLILVREPLIQTLFNRGEFARDPQAVDRVGLALFMYALGIWAFGLNQLLVRAFYALGNARAPLRVSLINMVLNLALNLVLVRTVLMEAGLALATSICACLQVVVLLILFNGQVRIQKDNGEREPFSSFLFPFASSLARTLTATAVMGAVVYGLDVWLESIQPAPPTRLAVLVLSGVASYIGVARLLRSEELRELLSRRAPE